MSDDDEIALWRKIRDEAQYRLDLANKKLAKALKKSGKDVADQSAAPPSKIVPLRRTPGRRS